MSQSTIIEGFNPRALPSSGGASRAAEQRHVARLRVWLAGMRLLVPATSLTLMISQSQFLLANPVLDAVRWSLMAVLCAMLLIRPRGRIQIRKPAVPDWIALVFIVIAFASAIYSSAPSLTVQRSLSTALLFFAVFWSIWSYADLVGGDRIAGYLLAMTTVMFAAGIVVLVVTDNAFWAGRFRGAFANPNAIGVLGILFLPVATARFLKTKRVSVLLVMGLLAGSLAYSGSRNGVLASALGMLLMLSRIHAWKAWVLLAAGATVIYLATPQLAPGDVPENKGLARLITTDRLDTGGGRVEAWQAAIPIIQQKIVFGYGFGTEELIFEGMSFRIHRGAYVHNSYLGLTYQLGLVGAALLFLPLIGFLVRRLISYHAIPPDQAAYEAVLLGGLVTCFFESWIYSAGNAFAFPFWIFVMLLARATMGHAEPVQAPVRRAKRARARYYLPRPSPDLVTPRRVIPPFDPPAQGNS